MEEKGPSQGTLEEIMARCDVLCTLKPLKLFKGSKEGTIKVGCLASIFWVRFELRTQHCQYTTAATLL